MMDSPESAQKLLSYGRSRLVGGQNIKMVFVSRESMERERELLECPSLTYVDESL